ncbi:MAG: MFS transporter [Clostridia bacterium]|nr:MFS transporter [Clostridia bacterium]
MIKEPKRIIPVIASIAIQMCLGTAYIWSVFQTGIAAYLFKGNSANALLTFSLLLAVLTVGSTIGGKIQQKIGTRKIIIIGGIVLALGFFLSSFVKPDFGWVIWITYGIIGGIGMGFIYSTSIACCQKWFPDKRGMITGIIVSALGFGGVIFTPIARSIIKSLGNGAAGIGELYTFAILAGIFLIVCTVGGIFIVDPPSGYSPKGWIAPEPKKGTFVQHFNTQEMLKTSQFYFVTVTFMLACMAGLMMIGLASQIAIAKGIAVEVATIGIMIISISNSFGRLFWGWMSDKLGRRNTIFALLLATSVLIIVVNFVSGYWIFALIALVGFAYGGFLGNFPALTADYFGSKNMSMNYGVVLLGFGAGAIASSYIAGYFKDIAKNDISLMFPAFIIASAAALIGAVLMLLIKHPKAKAVNAPEIKE